jgi:hypothetical protein
VVIISTKALLANDDLEREKEAGTKRDFTAQKDGGDHGAKQANRCKYAEWKQFIG